MSQVRPGALIAIIVFAAFAAYAFVAPATYRSSALLVVNAPSSGGPVDMPEPLEAARRLSEAILDRKTLERLSRERAGSSGSEAQAQAASQVRRGLEIDTSDGHTFSLSYRDLDARRSQAACNELARHAVELAPLVLLDHSAERALDLKRQQQTQELAAFLAQHPQVAAEQPASTSGPTSPDNDPAMSAFHAEKSNLERRIAQIESGSGSDNPYVDARESDPKLLRRRLAEIDAAVSARRQAFGAKPAGPELSADIRAEWRRLLEAVRESNTEVQSKSRPTLVARLTSPAALPSSPIDPNRRLLLFFGVVFGAGLGTAYVLAIRAAQQRRSSKSSRPAQKSVTEIGLGVHVPTAPPLPSGLGPAVPMIQGRLEQRNAPPIVPTALRPISSSPPAAPGPGARANGATHSSSGPPHALPATTGSGEAGTRTSSRPPVKRFSSTLVLPPAENPTLEDASTPDPVLATAAKAWDQQIRAHEVPGFAVVKSGSEHPGPFQTSSAPPPVSPSKVVSSVPPHASTVQRTNSRPANPMKVTQPLGSFSPDAVWVDPARAQARFDARSEPPHRSSPVPAASQSPIPTSPPPRSPVPGRAPSPAPGSQYSYVSTAPPTSSVPPRSAAPKTNVIRVQEVPKGWRPDPSLTPSAQRGLCEQLYAYAVENCFVLAVVGVPEAISYKSRVAAELALALAESGHPRILLLEGDLHRPLVQRLIGVDMPISTGFSQQLNSRSHGSADGRWTVLGCTKSLHVLAEGMMRSPGLLLSKQFSDCVQELRTYYDFIVIDGPTASLDVDSGALNAVTDGLVTVCPAKGSPALVHMQTLFGKKRFSAFATSP